MLNFPESLWALLGSSSFYPAIVQIVIGGGLPYLHRWLPSQDTMRDRARLKRNILLEKVSKSFERLLARLPTPGLDLKGLRGSPAVPEKWRPNLELDRAEQPDLIANYTAEFLQVVTDVNKLFRIFECVKACYWILFVTAAVGIIELLIALPFESVRPYISLVSYPMILFQMLLAAMARRWGDRFDECDTRA